MSTSSHVFGFTTRQLHAGQQPDPTTGSRAVPIYQTTSYQFRDTEHAANLFALKEFGNIYTRIMNPTTDVLEQRIAEPGRRRRRRWRPARGHAAQTMAILTLCGAGDHIVCSRHALRRHLQPVRLHLPAPGHRRHLRRSQRPGELRASAIRPNTKILYGETLGNPDINVFPFEEVAAIGQGARHPADDRQHLRHALPVPPVRVGRQHRHPLAPPSSSAATAPPSAASIVDGGNFDWTQRPLPQLHHARSDAITAWCTPTWASACRPSSSRRACRCCATSARCQSPFNSWLFAAGPGDAQPAHGAPRRSNAQAVAEFLASASQGQLGDLSRPDQPPRLRAGQEVPAQGRRARSWASASRAARRPARSSSRACKLFSHLANVGDAKSLAIHPASTTHSQLSRGAAWPRAGVTPDFIRLSIGLEDIEDILWDLDQALA